MATPKKGTSSVKFDEMYKRSVLDCVVEVAVAVAHDFSNRPELYQGVSPGTADNLTDLQSNVGFEESFPDNRIRTTLYRPIFGASDGLGNGNDNSPFQTTRMPVISAAVDFSEHTQSAGYGMLRERIRSAIVPFKNQIEDVMGASLDKTASRTEAVFNLAVSILSDSTVAGIFGISGQIVQGWPLDKDSTDPKGAKLIENITTQLQGISTGLVTREKFIRMQRIAEKGAASLEFILDGKFETDPDELDKLTAQLYAWGSDLGIIRQPTSTASAAPTTQTG